MAQGRAILRMTDQVIYDLLIVLFSSALTNHNAHFKVTLIFIAECQNNYTASQKTGHLLEHNFGKYWPTLTIPSLLQTEINYDHPTYPKSTTILQIC